MVWALFFIILNSYDLPTGYIRIAETDTEIACETTRRQFIERRIDEKWIFCSRVTSGPVTSMFIR